MNLPKTSVAMLIGLALVALFTMMHFPILGIAGFLALGALIGSGVQWGRDRKQTLILSEHLSPESRLLLRPVRRLAAFNREIARKHRLPVEQTANALDETEAVVRQCIRWLQLRDELIVLQADQSAAAEALADTRQMLQDATSDEDRASLEAALPALEEQLQHHAWVQRQLDQIDTRVLLSQYALEHLKTMLTLEAMQPDVLDAVPPSLPTNQSGIAMGG